MRTATSAFGPFGVLTLKEVVENIELYDESDVVYVKDDPKLLPWRPAVVAGENTGDALNRELGFRYLGEVDLAREAIEDFGRTCNDRDLEALLDLIEQYGM